MFSSPTRAARRAHAYAVIVARDTWEQFADALAADAAEPMPAAMVAAQVAANDAGLRMQTEYALRRDTDIREVIWRPYVPQTWCPGRIVNR